jgi:hypothetical protein
MTDKLWSKHDADRCRCPIHSASRARELWSLTVMWQAWYAGLFDVALHVDGEVVVVKHPRYEPTKAKEKETA